MLIIHIQSSSSSYRDYSLKSLTKFTQSSSRYRENKREQAKEKLLTGLVGFVFILLFSNCVSKIWNKSCISELKLDIQFIHFFFIFFRLKHLFRYALTLSKLV